MEQSDHSALRHRGPIQAPGAWARLAVATAVLLALVGCGGGAKKELEASKASAYHRLGLHRLQSGDARRALQDLTRAVNYEPRNPLYHVSLGLAYFSLGEYELAIEGYEKALRLDPGFTEAHTNMAMAYGELERFDRAYEHFRQAVADPGYLTPEKVYVNWGLTKARQGDEAGAEAMYRQAIETNPRYPRGHYEIGRLLEERGEQSEALAEYLKAWAGMSDVPELNLRLGKIYWEREEPTQARVYLEKVIAVAPDSVEATQARSLLERILPG